MGSHTPPDHSTSSSSHQQQYCLRWNNYQNNLTNVFDQLLQAEAFVDVTLSAEGHSLKAHKVVLCACSPYFQALFFDNPCKHPIVILNGVKWMQLKALTEFMYRGEINVAHDQLAPLLKVAELLKIRGLADVSHSRGTSSTNLTPSNLPRSSSSLTPNISSSPTTSHNNATSDIEKRPNPADFLSNSNHSHCSGSESPLNSLNGVSSLSRRKRRKMSTPERTLSPNDVDGDNDRGVDDAEDNLSSGDPDENDRHDTLNIHGSSGISMSVNPINPMTASAVDLQRVLSSNQGSSGLGSIGPALMNLHAAAAAAAAAGNGGNNAGGSSNGGSSSANDLDIKPGIVEMIREEERAKMLESSHGWLGPGTSTLSESYQYQIQNLWQKCWNQNQGGVMHALRFRERGPLKSWRPETMAEAIFAVLREGLSLSQAARKYDIPYPTFVLYANRVHNMLGPSADGSTSTDLMSDMRPKGRGRPQRILLGSWPEEHIRGVIRAVVFRDTQSKDDIPFVFNRDGTLCLPQPTSVSASTTPITNASTPSSQNGVDMSLHPHFSFHSPTTTPNTLASNNDSQRHSPSSSSSNSSSPLQQALTNPGNFNLNLQAVAQSQLLAFQQQHQRHMQQLQRSGNGSTTSGAGFSSTSSSSNKKLMAAGSSNFSLANLTSYLTPDGKPNLEGMKEILQIKSEMASYDDNEDDEENMEEKMLSLDTSVQKVATDLSISPPPKPYEKTNNNTNEEQQGPVVQTMDENSKNSSSIATSVVVGPTESKTSSPAR